MPTQRRQIQSDVANDVSSAEDVELDSDLIESKQRVSVHSRYYCTLKQERLKDGSVKQSYFYVYVTTGTLKRLRISLGVVHNYRHL